MSGQKEKVTQTYSIIPEISYLTGLTDEQRADFKVIYEQFFNFLLQFTGDFIFKKISKKPNFPFKKKFENSTGHARCGHIHAYFTKSTSK